MHRIHELKEKLLEELGDYADHSKFSKDDVESIKYMASAIDHMCNVIDRCEEEYSSNMGGSYNDGSYMDNMGRPMPYTRGGSFARGGRGGGNRGGRRGGANQYGSYDDGNEMIIRELRQLMDDAPNEQTKMEFKRFIQKMEQM